MTGFVLLLIIGGMAAIIWAGVDSHNRKLVDAGEADYFVKIAASGKGTTYHSLACNRSRGAVIVPLKTAQSERYAPCSSCGGKPTIRRLS